MKERNSGNSVKWNTRFGTWLPAFQKGRGWDGVGSRTLRFVLYYIIKRAELLFEPHSIACTDALIS